MHTNRQRDGPPDRDIETRTSDMQMHTCARGWNADFFTADIKYTQIFVRIRQNSAASNGLSEPPLRLPRFSQQHSKQRSNVGLHEHSHVHIRNVIDEGSSGEQRVAWLSGAFG